MSIEDRIAHLLEDGQSRSLVLKWGWLISLAFLVFGYGVIVFTLLG